MDKSISAEEQGIDKAGDREISMALFGMMKNVLFFFTCFLLFSCAFADTVERFYILLWWAHTCTSLSHSPLLFHSILFLTSPLHLFSHHSTPSLFSPHHFISFLTTPSFLSPLHSISFLTTPLNLFSHHSIFFLTTEGLQRMGSKQAAQRKYQPNDSKPEVLRVLKYLGNFLVCLFNLAVNLLFASSLTHLFSCFFLLHFACLLIH